MPKAPARVRLTVHSDSDPDIAEIHTSDRLFFRRCRRKWNWTSPLREGRRHKSPPMPLWAGTAFHYALEDFHGHNVYGDPLTALRAHLVAYRSTPRLVLPDGWEDEIEMLEAMMEYYIEWCKVFPQQETFWHNGEPQVEVGFKIDLPEEVQKMACKAGYKGAVYAGHIDKVEIDEWDRLWLLDYKTAKIVRHDHFEGDTQISAYCWAASKMYNRPVAGMIYQQHLKDFPRAPLELKDNSFSCNKQQKVTHLTLRRSLIERYGSVDKAPGKIVGFLNHLASVQPDEGDRMVSRDRINRNAFAIESQEKQIIMESMEMLNPDTYIYPNQQFTCSWDCDYKVPCVSMDDGSDWENDLAAASDAPDPSAPAREERWRLHLPPKERIQELYDGNSNNEQIHP